MIQATILFPQQAYASADRHVKHVKLLHQIPIAWPALLFLQSHVLNVLLAFSLIQSAAYHVLFMVRNVNNAQTQLALSANHHLHLMALHVYVITLKGSI